MLYFSNISVSDVPVHTCVSSNTRVEEESADVIFDTGILLDTEVSFDTTVVVDTGIVVLPVEGTGMLVDTGGILATGMVVRGGIGVGASTELDNPQSVDIETPFDASRLSLDSGIWVATLIRLLHPDFISVTNIPIFDSSSTGMLWSFFLTLSVWL